MAGRLTNKDRDQLEKWIGTGPKTFTLLYAITRDGCDAKVFHEKCDGQGPTVTVLYNAQKSVYGGYSPSTWNSANNAYSSCIDAFLFQLYHNGTEEATKFVLKQGQYHYAVFNQTNYGPTFGGGHDFYTFNGTVNRSGSTFPLNGHTKCGYSYEMQGFNMDDINNGTLNVTELEVYKVSYEEKKTRKPWRDSEEWDTKELEKLKERILTFKPFTDLNISQTRIAMIGPVGAGKSSFYNTLDTIFRGRITQRACSGSAEASITTGFNQTSPLTPETEGFREVPTVQDKIHCVLFVLDATTLDVLPSKVVEKMKKFQQLMNQREIPQLIILTKIDKLCEDVKNDISFTYRSWEVEKHVEKASQLLGLRRCNVLPVKNYEDETKLDVNINILTLQAVSKMLDMAEDYMHNLLDRQQLDEMKIKEK